MNEVIVREARICDLAELQALFSHVDEHHHDALPHIFRSSSEITRPRELIEKYISQENVLFLVASSGGAVVGLLHAELRTDNHPILATSSYGHISDVIVSPSLKRTGIGKALMEKARDWFTDRNIDEVRLTVFAFNEEAIAFYKKLGFSSLHTTMSASLYD